MMRKILTLCLIFVIPVTLFAQNTVITDDETYTGHNSAMLDVYSLSKGLLVPRLTSAQRGAISSPADGLLVYDTDLDKYYFFGNSTWNPIDAPSLWSENSDTIFITGVGKRYGVGTASPIAKLTVQGDATIASDEPLFEVKNSTGDVIFAVYENEVKVNFKEPAKGVKGGFAVGGLSGTKADPVEYMRITPDSVRIYINDPVTKGVKGGFAVGGLSGTKASRQNYFTVERDSARIYVDEPTKGVKGGFAVGGLSGTKGTGVNYLDLTPENYLIGHGSGSNITTGLNNSFFGYYSGLSTTSGSSNVFVGPYSGYSNQDGYRNVFIGWYSGYSNIGGAGSDGDFNVFVGTEAGRYNETGYKNIYIGNGAGRNGTGGRENIIVGNNAGMDNEGQWNVFIGVASGYQNIEGSNNTYLGYRTGFTDTASSNNTFIGSFAGNKSTANWNTYVGSMAGQNTESGLQNVFVGYSTARDKISGNFNTYVGNSAGENDISGYNNVFLGYRAGYENNNGWDNVYVGNLAGAYNENGDDNTVIGPYAGRGDFNGATFERSVIVGHMAGYSLTTGSDNVLIGNKAGYALTTESDKLYITNDNVTPLLYGEFDNQLVGVNTTAPQATVHVVGSSTLGSLMISPNEAVSGDDAEIMLAGDNAGARYMSMRYDGGTNRLEWHAHYDGTDRGPLAAIAYSTSTGISSFVTMHHMPAMDNQFDLGSSAYRWDDVYATNGTIVTSDKRLKDNIEPLSYGLQAVLSMNPVAYYWKDNKSKGRKIGLIAQELIKIVPEVVNVGDDPNQTLGIRYSEMTPILIKAIQEQQNEIDDLKKRLENLEKLLNK